MRMLENMYMISLYLNILYLYIIHFNGTYIYIYVCMVRSKCSSCTKWLSCVHVVNSYNCSFTYFS